MSMKEEWIDTSKQERNNKECNQNMQTTKKLREFSRKRKHENSTSSKFVKLLTWAYKKARQSSQRVGRILSVSCKGALRVKSTVVI